MTSLPQVFNGHQVRSIFKDDAPVWVLKDVCGVLGIKNHNDAAKRLDDDEKEGVSLTDPTGRPQQYTVVNESGLYHLIVRSDKPVAKEFRRWITHEVLPAIRKSGSYSTVPAQIDDNSEVIHDLVHENIELKDKYMLLLEEKTARLEKDLIEAKKPAKRKFAHQRKNWNALEKAEVQRMHDSGVGPTAIGRIFGVTRGAISDLVRRMHGESHDRD